MCKSTPELSPCFLIQTLLRSSVNGLHNGIATSLSRHIRLLVSDLVKKALQAIVGLETSWGSISNAEEGAHTKEEDDRLHCLVLEGLIDAWMIFVSRDVFHSSSFKGMSLMNQWARIYREWLICSPFTSAFLVFSSIVLWVCRRSLNKSTITLEERHNCG